MNILVADDHQLFLDGLRHVLRGLATDPRIIEACDAGSAIAHIDSEPDIDLMLLDIDMPGMNGLGVLRHMEEQGSLIPTVVVSAETDTVTIRTALELGALGFIPKSYGAEALLGALGKVLEGEIFLPVELRQRLDSADDGDMATTPAGLTPRQLEVLTLVGRGYSNRQIATQLYLTENTVKSHLKVLFQTFGSTNRTECVLEAQRRGLITAEP